MSIQAAKQRVIVSELELKKESLEGKILEHQGEIIKAELEISHINDRLKKERELLKKMSEKE